MRRALSGRLGRDARWMTFNWRSYIESVFSAYASMNTIKAQAEQCSSPWTSGEDIADLLQPPPYAARGGGGSAVGGSGSGRYSRTSQQRTRSRKRMTSLCFFLLSSSRYLWAPIWWKHSLSANVSSATARVGSVAIGLIHHCAAFPLQSSLAS